MPSMRTYGDGCGIAHGLDLVGERWALLVVRELVLGPKRFTDLRTGLPNASPNVLAQRLRELESAGIVVRRRLPPPAAASVYELTEWGRGLDPIVRSLGAWALGSPAMPHDEPSSVDSLVIALQTFLDAEAAGDLDARYDLRVGDDRYELRVTEGALTARRGTPDQADAVIDIDAPTFRALLEGDTDPAGLEVDGDRDAVLRLFGSFRLSSRPAAQPASSR